MSDFLHKDLKQPFPWGPVVAVHRIAEYTIVEHHPQIFKNGCGTGRYEMGRTEFTCVLSRKPYEGVIYEGAKTLDQALLICIGNAHGTSGAVRYAAQLLMEAK